MYHKALADRREEIITALSHAFQNNLEVCHLDTLTSNLKGYAGQIYYLRINFPRHCNSFNPYFRIMCDIKKLQGRQSSYYAKLVERVGILNFKIDFTIPQDRDHMLKILSFRTTYGQDINGAKGRFARKILLDLANTHYQLNNGQAHCNVGLVFQYAPFTIFKQMVDEIKKLQNPNISLLALAEIVNHQDMNALIAKLRRSHCSCRSVQYEGDLIDRRNFIMYSIWKSINFDLAIAAIMYFIFPAVSECLWAASGAFGIATTTNALISYDHPFTNLTNEEAQNLFENLIERRADKILQNDSCNAASKFSGPLS